MARGAGPGHSHYREFGKKAGKRMQSNWAPAHSKALCEYYAKGMSFAAIAETINAKFKTSYTRNAVLGRATRMGLAGTSRSQDGTKSLPISSALALAYGRSMKNKSDEQFSEKAAKARFEAALKGAMNTPYKPLKEKPKVKKVAAKKRKKSG
jgi:hypothetical protein